MDRNMRPVPVEGGPSHSSAGQDAASGTASGVAKKKGALKKKKVENEEQLRLKEQIRAQVAAKMERESRIFEVCERLYSSQSVTINTLEAAGT
jgi:hypothetical protein